MEYCASHRHQDCSASKKTRPISIFVLFLSFLFRHKYSMRARLKGMVMLRKALSARAFPTVENILEVDPKMDRITGKKYCRMPTRDTMPDDKSKVYKALNNWAR